MNISFVLTVDIERPLGGVVDEGKVIGWTAANVQFIPRVGDHIGVAGGLGPAVVTKVLWEFEIGDDVAIWVSRVDGNRVTQEDIDRFYADANITPVYFDRIYLDPDKPIIGRTQ